MELGVVCFWFLHKTKFPCASLTGLSLFVVFKQDFYPINFLRNIAMNHSLTPYVFLCDIDFLPMVGLYEYAKRTVMLLNSNSTRKV